jgi:two-component system, sensor histidine kinase FlrB
MGEGAMEEGVQGMSAMPNLAAEGQTAHGPGVVRSQRDALAKADLTKAFLSFTQAAGSLERSYAQLQAEVVRLAHELERANTELERSHEENLRVRRYLSRVLESLPCGVLVVNEKGEVQITNTEARKLLQVPHDWTSGDGRTLPESVGRLLKEAPANSFFLEQEWTSSFISGVRTIGILRASINDAVESATETIWIVRDKTEEKRMAADRESARRSRALAEVAAVLAHEIRNPLGSMELFTGLLADATAHMPETRQWMTHLQAGLRGLSATVNNVLQFHGEPTKQFVPVELDRLVTETMDFLQPVARQRGQQIMVENAIGKVDAKADASRLRQVFLNLSLNGFRAMPPGGKLHVRLGWAPQFPRGLVQLDFKDEGRGVPAELLDRIYEPGFTTIAGSPGLGLAVCKKVVEEHGGEIRVMSRPKHGATFSLFLPVTGVDV